MVLPVRPGRFVSTRWRRAVYRFLGRKEKSRGLALRARALHALSQPGIESKFICRHAYWAGTTGRRGTDAEGRRRSWEEFVANLLETDYNLAIRGAGNFSYRLYETLAAGRIPVLVNTRCVLPFPEEINWQRHCVWVEEDELESAGEALRAFHQKISEEEFLSLQQENRKLWEEWLCPLAFYRRAVEKARQGR